MNVIRVSHAGFVNHFFFAHTLVVAIGSGLETELNWRTKSKS